MPLGLFADRNFSVVQPGDRDASSFAFTAMGFPLMLWAQLVRGYSPTQAGLLLAPMAVTSILAAPVAGRLTDRVHPACCPRAGFAALGVSLLLLAVVARARHPAVAARRASSRCSASGSSFLWGPLATTANRNLPPQRAGAGSGVYNATRQVGAVLGSAAIAVLIDARLAANGLTFSPDRGAGGGDAPRRGRRRRSPTRCRRRCCCCRPCWCSALVAVLFFERPRTSRPARASPPPHPRPGSGSGRRRLSDVRPATRRCVRGISGRPEPRYAPLAAVVGSDVSRPATSRRSAGSRRPRRCARPCRPRRPCPRRAGRRASCCRPRRRPSARRRSWRTCGRRRGG